MNGLNNLKRNNMEKIPTVEEFLDSLYRKKGQTMFDAIEQAMIEFAKLHVEQALKEASKKSKNKEGQITDHKLTNSILNSYPLSNIK